MNKSIIRRIIGYVMLLEGLMLLLPVAVALYYGENEGIVYLIVSAIEILIGAAVVFKKPTENVFYLKEGCVATALSWITLSVFGCLPFYFTGEIPNITNALFETVSGFSTTGATILEDVEILSKCSLFWRSFTHWIGGMGVLVFLLAVVQMAGGSNINLMKAESPGPSVSKLAPKMRYTARILYIIYFVLTLLEIIFLVCGDMPLFDACTTAFGTAGTGGFSIKNDSIGGYSLYIQWVVTVFMFLFGINFNFYYYIIFRQFAKITKMEEVRAYFLIVFASVGIIFADIIHIYHNVGEALSKSAFQVAALITTTGYSTADFNTWSSTSKTVLVMLMFVGACAGSTGGGIKVSRFIVVFKSIIKEIHSYIHPKSVRKITLDSKPVEHSTIRATNVYFITFIMMYATSLFLISFDNFDMTTNFTAIIATINNIGPGLELVGPTQNFNLFSDFSKFVLMFDMLAGRLELFPLLLFISPQLWIDAFKNRSRKKSK